MTMEGNEILIIGSNTLQNELMASLLEKETSAGCFAVDNYAEFKPGGQARKLPLLLLYDCQDRDPDTCVEECASLPGRNRNGHILCLFNLKKGAGVEEGLVTRGVRGFFYQGEPFTHLARGVRAVLNGELWVSRKIMTDLITRNNYRAEMVRQDILSRREVDILTLIVEGATNEKIAGQLYISKHTVKTHLYHIFKKINVNSRFQAALWAAKHL